MLATFFESISWPMEPPPAYGAFHILFTLIGFAVCGFSAWKLRNVSDKTACHILFACGLVLTLSEVFKQFFCYYVIADGTYHWGEFPFQLCSIPMYLCLIVPWLKLGKLRRALYSFMVLYNLLGGAIAFTEPSGLLHGHLFLTAHSCVWHMLLVFVGLFLCAVQARRQPEERLCFCDLDLHPSLRRGLCPELHRAVWNRQRYEYVLRWPW